MRKYLKFYDFFLLFSMIIGMTNCNLSPRLSPNIADPVSNSFEDTVLLEVLTTMTGEVYPKGEVLTLRLYDNGNVEFDDFPKYVPEDRIPFRKEKKISKISSEEIERIKEILNQNDLLEAKPKYKPTKPMLDSKKIESVTFNNNGKSKIIVIEENDVVLKLGSNSPYPKSLVNLINLVDDLNKKLRNKE